MSWQVLQRGAIYRIVYNRWHTVPRPIAFILYSSPFKVHALALNDPRMSPSDAVNFSRFIIKMKAIPNVETWGGRVLYRILKTYFPDIIRKCYRTYTSVYVGQISLVSSGILPSDSFSGYEKSSYNENLYRDASYNQIFRIISQRTKTATPKPLPVAKAPFYVPPNPGLRPNTVVLKTTETPSSIDNVVEETVPSNTEEGV